MSHFKRTGQASVNFRALSTNLLGKKRHRYIFALRKQGAPHNFLGTRKYRFGSEFVTNIVFSSKKYSFLSLGQ